MLKAKLTERQQREQDYHVERAAEKGSVILARTWCWDVIEDPSRRWWNAYWTMYAYICRKGVRGKRVLVVGCGFGDDALYLAKLGAEVYAFDLSPDSLDIARTLAKREGLTIQFDAMPAEKLTYENDFFDFVIAHDILHHVDIPVVMAELRRVGKTDAVLVVNEIYSHSLTDKIRHSRLVEKHLYPAMQGFIYGPGKPYITQDERKMTERDLAMVSIPSPELTQYFNVLVTRIVPDRYTFLAKLDRVLLIILKPLGRLFAGRVLLAGRIVK